MQGPLCVFFKRRRKKFGEAIGVSSVGAEAVTKKPSRGVHVFAVVVACLTFLLVIAGALVTSHDAGLSVPDWPTSFGTYRIPRMVGGVRYEDGHRMIAGVVATLTVILAIFIWGKEPRRWVKWLAGFAVLAVIVQAVLGGLGVLHFLETVLTVSHSSMAQIYFCIMVSLAIFTSPRWRWDGERANDPGKPDLHRCAIALNIIILIQIMLGAVFRNQVQDQLGRMQYVHTIGVVPHIVGAGVVLGFVFYLLMRIVRVPGRDPALLIAMFLLVTLVVVQVFLGVGVYLMMLISRSAPEPVGAVVMSSVAHVAVGALIFTGSVVLTYLTYRYVSRPSRTVITAAEPVTTGGSSS